jgi:hypothetical protein
MKPDAGNAPRTPLHKKMACTVDQPLGVSHASEWFHRRDLTRHFPALAAFLPQEHQDSECIRLHLLPDDMLVKPVPRFCSCSLLMFKCQSHKDECLKAASEKSSLWVVHVLRVVVFRLPERCEFPKRFDYWLVCDRSIYIYLLHYSRSQNLISHRFISLRRDAIWQTVLCNLHSTWQSWYKNWNNNWLWNLRSRHVLCLQFFFFFYLGEKGRISVYDSRDGVSAHAASLSPPSSIMHVHRCIGSRNGTRQTLPTSPKLTHRSDPHV